jgi:hypothetical protein
MIEAWFIDALDGLSGQAFASYRETGQLEANTELKGSSWFISAPSFTPEPVSSSAIGLAAAQRGLQLGLSMNGDTEVVFTSLEALSDYVRRLYLSGGGGDGPSGLDPTPGGPEEPEGPDDRESPREGEAFSESVSSHQELLFNFAKTLTNQSKMLPNGQTSTELLPLPLLQESFLSKKDGDILYHAGRLIFAEIDRQKHDTSPMQRQDFHKLNLAHNGFRAVLGLLDLMERFDLHDELLTRREYIYWGRRHVADLIQSDIMDVLAQLPIPVQVCQSWSATERWRSVKDLFFSILGNPAHLTQTNFPLERSALFLFAAASIVQRTPHHRYGYYDHGELLAEVFDWLRPQMPQFAFSKELETTLSDIGRK